MSFGDVIRYASSPHNGPDGIGGDENVIWSCDFEYYGELSELSTTDFSAIRVKYPSNDLPQGMGGNASVIWNCDEGPKKVYELRVTDFSIVRSGDSPGIDPSGIGGDVNTLWHGDYNLKKVYELSTSDFSIIKTENSPNIGPHGIGGDANTIWYCDNTSDEVYELNTSDLSVLRNTSSPNVTPTGIGGNANVIWHCDAFTGPGVIYELDVASTYTLSGTVSDEFGNTIRDADLTISNGTTYTTTTDENGDYSQVVNADTYNIAVSKSRSTYHDITISSVVVAADTTQDITMLLDKVLGIQNALKGISIPGGISMGRSKR